MILVVGTGEVEVTLSVVPVFFPEEVVKELFPKIRSPETVEPEKLGETEGFPDGGELVALELDSEKSEGVLPVPDAPLDTVAPELISSQGI